MSSKSRETFLKQLQDGSYESKQKEVYEQQTEKIINHFKSKLDE